MIKELLKTLNERPIAFQPVYIKLTGSLGAGYLLSQIIYWYYKKGGEFYKTDSNWMEELFIGEKVLRTAKSKLKSLDFIKISVRGNQRRTFYKIDEDRLAEALVGFEKQNAQRASCETKAINSETEQECSQTDEMAVCKPPKGQVANRPLGSLQNAQRAELYNNETETTTETTTESNDKSLEQSSKNSSQLGKNENKEEIEKTDSEKVPGRGGEVPSKIPEAPIEEEYGNQEINAILKILHKAVGIDQFKETQQRQRIYGKHFVTFIKTHSKEEFIQRLRGVLADEFKQKNCNSIKYLYGEIKSFIHSPMVETNTLNPKNSIGILE